MTDSPPPRTKTPIKIPLSALVDPPQPQPHNPLHHISFGVRSYSASKAFYSAVLPPLGLSLVFDSESPSHSSSFQKPHIRTLGYGPDPDHEIINIFEVGPEVAKPPGAGFHLALNAPTRLAVVEFHAAAVQNGGTDNGLPGVREEYGKNYFAAFVRDPDGWGLEVVCKRRLGDEEEEEGGKRKEEGEGEGEGEKGKGERMGEKAEELGEKVEEKAEGVIERVEDKMGRKDTGMGEEGNGEVEFERVDVDGKGSVREGESKHLYSVGEGTVRL